MILSLRPGPDNAQGRAYRLGGLSDPSIHLFISVDFIGSGMSHSVHNHVRRPLPPGGRASTKRFPQLGQSFRMGGGVMRTVNVPLAQQL